MNCIKYGFRKGSRFTLLNEDYFVIILKFGFYTSSISKYLFTYFFNLIKLFVTWHKEQFTKIKSYYHGLPFGIVPTCFEFH